MIYYLPDYSVPAAATVGDVFFAVPVMAATAAVTADVAPVVVRLVVVFDAVDVVVAAAT